MLSKFGAYWVAPICAPSGSGPLLLLDHQSFTVSTMWSTSFDSIQFVLQFVLQNLSPSGKTSFRETQPI